MKEFSLKRHKIAQISESKIATPNISNPWIQFLETQIWATGWGERGQLKKTTGGFPDPPPRVNRHANIRTLLKLQGSYSGGGHHSFRFLCRIPNKNAGGHLFGGQYLGKFTRENNHKPIKNRRKTLGEEHLPIVVKPPPNVTQKNPCINCNIRVGWKLTALGFTHIVIRYLCYTSGVLCKTNSLQNRFSSP